jgi:hypothetical protein
VICILFSVQPSLRRSWCPETDAYEEEEDTVPVFNRYQFMFDTRFVKDNCNCLLVQIANVLFSGKVCQQLVFPEEHGHAGHLHHQPGCGQQGQRSQGVRVIKEKMAFLRTPLAIFVRAKNDRFLTDRLLTRNTKKAGDSMPKFCTLYLATSQLNAVFF